MASRRGPRRLQLGPVVGHTDDTSTRIWIQVSDALARYRLRVEGVGLFEFESTELGAQSALGGGGRYDGLVEMLGGPATPGVGWAAGVERILLASEFDIPAEQPVYIAGPAAGRLGFLLATSLRRRGVPAEVEQAGRSLKGQFKHADRIGARAVVILGDDGIEIKDMATGEQHSVESADDVLKELA